MYVVIVKIFGVYFFVGCGFYEWWFVEENCVLVFYDDWFVVYCWYVGVVGCVWVYYDGDLCDFCGWYCCLVEENVFEVIVIGKYVVLVG